ncbi:MAG: serine/threonine-protein phosphatase [Anaerolineaceae bacterium]|nr:serine/threonine-protein phosphatase [Anaerolineaceae bacterium]
MFQLINKIFRRGQQSASVEVKTVPLSEEISTNGRKSDLYMPPQLVVGSSQSIGKQRDHNEDALFSLNIMKSDEKSDSPFGIFIVADGMGGHQHGEVASSSAMRAMSEYLIKKIYSPLMGTRPEALDEPLQEIMEYGISEAQQAVLRNAPGGGTTITAAIIIDEQLTIAHVGDSRAYLLTPGGQMKAISQDHSLVQRLIDLGQLTEEEAAVHPQRNVLYRALGQMEPFHPDVRTFTFPNNGILLLCSDGLWGVVSESTMFDIVMQNDNPTIACRKLVDAANEAGGPDNITVILVKKIK